MVCHCLTYVWLTTHFGLCGWLQSFFLHNLWVTIFFVVEIPLENLTNYNFYDYLWVLPISTNASYSCCYDVLGASDVNVCIIFKTLIYSHPHKFPSTFSSCFSLIFFLTSLIIFLTFFFSCIIKRVSTNHFPYFWNLWFPM